MSTGLFVLVWYEDCLRLRLHGEKVNANVNFSLIFVTPQCEHKFNSLRTNLEQFSFRFHFSINES